MKTTQGLEAPMPPPQEGNPATPSTAPPDLRGGVGQMMVPVMPEQPGEWGVAGGGEAEKGTPKGPLQQVSSIQHQSHQDPGPPEAWTAWRDKTEGPAEDLPSSGMTAKRSANPFQDREGSTID